MTRSPKKVCSRIGLAFLAMMALWMAGSMVLVPLLQYLMPNWQTNGIGIWLMNDIPLYLLGMPAFLLILWGLPNGEEPPREKKRLSVGQFLLVIVFCLGAMYALSFVTNIITMLIDSLRGSASTNNLAAMTENSNILINLLFGAVVPALGEEFVFRYTLRKKLRGAGDKIYIFFSAFCFGMFHGNLSQMCYAMAVGAMLAYVYTRTGNIWLSVSLHFIINSLGLVAVPALMEYGGDLAIALMGLATLILAAAAAILLGVCYRRIAAEFVPPSEPGWPHKAPPPAPQWEAAYRGPAYPPAYQQGYPQSYHQAPAPYAPGYPQAQYPPAHPASYPPPQAAAAPPPYGQPFSPPFYGQPQQQSPYGQPYSPPYPPPAPPQPPFYGAGAPPAGPYPVQQPPYGPYPGPSGYPAYGGPYPAPWQPPYYGYPPAPPKTPGAARLCLVNLGMLLYICATSLLALLALFG